MKNNRFQTDMLLHILSYAIFFLSVLFLCHIIRTRSIIGLDSDMSSELILAKMLKDEGRILTPNWYYGTELRILYYTQISAILFNFTDNWHIVRVCTNIIMLLILAVSIWCLCSRLNIKKYFPVAGLILLLPFSSGYYSFILYGAYYIPCIATSFFGMALVLHYVQTSDKKKKTAILTVSIVLAVASSLIGYRQAAVFYAPAVLGSAIIIAFELYRDKIPFKESRSKSLLIINLANLIGAGIGCIINITVLIKIYPVEDWNRLSFTGFNLDRFINTVCGMLRNLGYREDSIGIGTLISNGYSMVLFMIFIYAVYFTIKMRQSLSVEFLFCSLSTVCAMLILCLLYSFTDMDYLDRYSAPMIVFVIPVVILLIDQIQIREEYRLIISIALGLCACLVSVHVYKEIKTTDRTAEHREIAEYLTDQGYENGYATFWNANVMTELSNGYIEVHNWDTNIMLPLVYSVNTTMPWLQKVSHASEIPEGKLFQLFNRQELYYCNWKDNLTEDDQIYETENYVVYGYPSYDEMLLKISGQDPVLSEGELNEGTVNGDTVTLNSQGSLSIQDLSLYRGTNRITATGENLTDTKLTPKHYVKGMDHSLEYESRIISQTAEEIIIEVSIPEETSAGKLELINSSPDSCTVSGIHIVRSGA